MKNFEETDIYKETIRDKRREKARAEAISSKYRKITGRFDPFSDLPVRNQLNVKDEIKRIHKRRQGEIKYNKIFGKKIIIYIKDDKIYRCGWDGRGVFKARLLESVILQPLIFNYTPRESDIVRGVRKQIRKIIENYNSYVHVIKHDDEYYGVDRHVDREYSQHYEDLKYEALEFATGKQEIKKIKYTYIPLFCSGAPVDPSIRDLCDRELGELLTNISEINDIRHKAKNQKIEIPREERITPPIDASIGANILYSHMNLCGADMMKMFIDNSNVHHTKMSFDDIVIMFCKIKKIFDTTKDYKYHINLLRKKGTCIADYKKFVDIYGMTHDGRQLISLYIVDTFGVSICEYVSEYANDALIIKVSNDHARMITDVRIKKQIISAGRIKREKLCDEDYDIDLSGVPVIQFSEMLIDDLKKAEGNIVIIVGS